MAKLRINGDSSGYVDLEAPNAASSSTLDLDQVPQKNAANTFTTGQNITVPGNGGLTIQAGTNGSASLRLKNDATDWDVNCQTTDNFAIYNHATGGSRLSITPAGIVTMPQQPAFSAASSSHDVNGVIVFNLVSINTGNHYNTSNGYFTAPVAGNYFFSSYGMSLSGVSTNLRMRFLINGAAFPAGEHNGGVGYTGGGSYRQNQMNTILPLSVNDTVAVEWQGGYANMHEYHNKFSGFLIG